MEEHLDSKVVSTTSTLSLTNKMDSSGDQNVVTKYQRGGPPGSPKEILLPKSRLLPLSIA